MRPAIKRTALTLAALLGIAVLALAGLLLFGLDTLRPAIARELSRALDRPVAIEGSLSLGWSQGPALAAEGITIAGDSGRPPLVEAGRIDVRLAPGALLGGAVMIDRLVLADVVIRPDSYGAGGSATTGEPTVAAPSELSIFSDDATLELVNITVETGGPDLPFAIETLQLASPGAEVTRLQAAIAWGGVGYDLTISGGSLATLLGGMSWPVELVLANADTDISARGTLSGLPGAPSANLVVEGVATGLDLLLAPLAVETGIDGPVAFEATVAGNPDRIALTELRVTAGEAEATADLVVALAASPVAITGRLAISALPDGEGGAGGELQDLLDTAVPYGALQAIDLDLDLTIANHALGALVLTELELPLRLDEGHLDISPLRFRIEGETLTGRLQAHADRNEITLSMRADRVPLGELLQKWRPELTLTGEIGRLSLDAQASGPTLRDLLASLAMDLKGQAAVLAATWEDGTASQATLDTFSARAGTGDYLTVQATGTADGNPASLFLTTGQLRELVSGSEGWPLELHVGNDDVGVDLVGVVMHPDTASGLRLEGLLRASDIARIAALLDINLPMKGRSQGYFHVSDIADGWRFDWIDATVGNSQAQGSLDVAVDDETVSVSGDLSGSLLSIVGDEGETDIDAAFLEQGDLDGVTLDLDLAFDRITLAPLHFDQVATRLLLGDGVLTTQDGKATLLGAPATLSVSIDAAQPLPVFAVQAEAGNIDPDNVGNDLGLQGLLQGHIDRAALEMTASGTTLRALAEAATANLSLQGGSLQIGTDAVALEFRNLELHARPDEPMSGEEEIVLAGIPIALALSFVPLVDLIAKPSPWILESRASLLGLDIAITRSITPALEVYASPVTMELKSEDIRTALAEVGMTMPQALPLDAVGTVQVLKDSVAFQLDRTQLAGSDLAGSLELSFNETPQRITAQFASQRVVIDDFLEPEDTAPDPAAAEEERDLQALLATALPAWTMPELALDLQLDAREMLWSDNVLGNVGARILIAGDTLRLDTLQADVFNGSVAGSLALKPIGADTQLSAQLEIDHIDSDKLLREAGIAEAASGEMALDMTVDSRGATFAGLLAALDGRMQLKRGEGWMKSGAIEVLTKNILAAMLSSLFDPAERTPIRCIVVNVDFAAGVGTLEHSAVALENVVIIAEGGLDLGRQTIDVELEPKAIDWSFLRLLTPVYVKGDLFDPKVSPRTGEILAGLGAALFGAGPIFDGDLDVLCAGT